MTSKEIFDVLCLKNKIDYTYNIEDIGVAKVSIHQSAGVWIVKQLCENNPYYNFRHFYDSAGIIKYIKSHRNRIQTAIKQQETDKKERKYQQLINKGVFPADAAKITKLGY